MLITFKSKASGDIPMFAEDAKALLAVLGKDYDPTSAPRGIITAKEAPAALEKLKKAADTARVDQREKQDLPDAGLTVSLSQRAFPLIAMLERAAKANADVVWGV
jgi:hypothetical protein